MKPLVDLPGKRSLVIGIANEQSIAAGCAAAFAACGARLAATYLNEGQPMGGPVADRFGIELTAPCHVQVEGKVEAPHLALKIPPSISR